MSQYKDPNSIFPDWIRPQTRRILIRATVEGVAIFTYPANESSIEAEWVHDGGFEALTDGMFVLQGNLALNNTMSLGALEVVSEDKDGQETVHRVTDWHQLIVTDQVSGPSFLPGSATRQAERDALAFTTQRLLGLEQNNGQGVPGAAVAQRLSHLADEFERLLATEGMEEELQTFLNANSAILDLRALSIEPKVKLGSDYVTDFVIRLPGDEYILVEIERATHRLYNRSGNPTAALTHAVQQVEDWLEWAYENTVYLRNSLPAIHEPRGLVILGRRSTLDTKSTKALRRRNVISKVRVITFDDLLEQLRAVAANLLQQ